MDDVREMNWTANTSDNGSPAGIADDAAVAPIEPAAVEAARTTTRSGLRKPSIVRLDAGFRYAPLTVALSKYVRFRADAN